MTAKKKVAPTTSAPIEEHRKHAEEFLLREEHKTKPVGYQPTDEAKE